jgi:hypothetical protein
VCSEAPWSEELTTTRAQRVGKKMQALNKPANKNKIHRRGKVLFFPVSGSMMNEKPAEGKPP